MAKAILMDEFHVTVFARQGLPEATYTAIRETLDDARFHADLRRAVRDVFRRHPSLRKVRITISR